MMMYKNSSVTEMFDDKEEEYILYDSFTSKVKMLNKMGAYIWTQLPQAPFEREAFIATFLKKFKEINENATEVISDIEHFIDDMIKEGVLVVQFGE